MDAVAGVEFGEEAGDVGLGGGADGVFTACTAAAWARRGDWLTAPQWWAPHDGGPDEYGFHGVLTAVANACLLAGAAFLLPEPSPPEPRPSIRREAVNKP